MDRTTTRVVDCTERTTSEWIALVIEVVIFLIIVIGNSLVIVSIAVVKILQHPRNLLVLSLAVSDFLVGVFVVPFKIYLTEKCDVNIVYCYIWICAHIMLCTASILCLTVIAIDRYIAIEKPLFHRIHFTRNKFYWMITIIWILAFVLTTPYWLRTAIHYEPVDNDGTLPICMNQVDAWHQIICILLAFFLPLTILLFVYGRIASILKIQSTLKLRPAHTWAHYVDGTTLAHTCAVCKFFQEKKGCIMMGIVLLCFIGCWLPVIVLLIVEGAYEINGSSLDISSSTVDLLMWFGYFHSCLNPFIYTMFCKDFRFAFKELLCCRCLTINSRIRSDLYSKQMVTTTTSINSRNNVNPNVID